MRPEGWDATKIIAERIGEVTSFTTLEMLIEAGADAMLEGLKKSGTYKDRYNRLDCYGITLEMGYLVFIPED